MSLLLFAVLSLASLQTAALPRAVPYLPQTEALCGGAAAAMVIRYWGAASVRPEDFASLIDHSQGGIVTTALVADLQRRGWQAFPLRGGPGEDAPLAGHLARGRPIIALIEDRPSRYHYVVITALEPGRVHFHDPAAAPSQTLARSEFDRRWRAANFWMLLLLPGKASVPGTDHGTPAEPDASGEADLASQVATLLRSGDHETALRLANDATRRDPASALAWDALGTTLFVMDRDLAALEAWNRAGKPDVDTVQVAGVRRTRFRAVEQMIDLQPGVRLTAARLERARRRLAFLPSASATRVSYAPQPDGRAQIDAAIVERPRRPAGLDLAVTAAKAPFSREVELALANLVRGGERVTAAWRFRKGFERVAAAVETPAPLPVGAVWRLSGFDQRETFPSGEEGWRRAGFQAADWVTPAFGWTAGVAVDRWHLPHAHEPANKVYAAARGLIAAGDRIDVQLTGERWMTGTDATRIGGRLHWRIDVRAGRIAAIAGAETVGGEAPRFLHPGAGDGHLRRPLLRAHPLVQDGAIGVTNGRLAGRRLAHATIEWTHPLRRIGIAALDAALFTDAARAWRLLDSRVSDAQVDAGIGLRARLAGTGTSFRLDAARGLRDGRWAVTAGTIVPFEWWIF